ncbi:MAG: MerR family transcriptional regulator [Clostridia bacterium]|nr:MerR family transcriptional regulator [Clostridia bacterium]
MDIERTGLYSIQEVSRKTGLTAHTLRYYEKEGLLNGVVRSPGGFRQYTDEDLERLGLICCLKNTGMSIQEIARFVQLTREGEHTLEERVKLLREHRDRVLARMTEMQQHLDKVTWKLNFFTEKLKVYEAGKDQRTAAGETAEEK